MSLHFAILLITCASLAHSGGDNVCGSNEKESLCGRMCEPTCANPKPKAFLCPGIACTDSTKGCRCDKGFLRNKESDSCVKPSDCPLNNHESEEMDGRQYVSGLQDKN